MLLLVLFINFNVDSPIRYTVINTWDTWMLKLVKILIYLHLPGNKLSLRIAPQPTIYYFSVSYNNFSIVTDEKKMRLLELKECLIIIRAKTSLNRNSTLRPFSLFDRSSNKISEFYLFLKVTWVKKSILCLKIMFYV